MLTAFWSWIEDNIAQVIACSAFLVALYQTLATRHHNRLSVRPHLCDHDESQASEGIYRYSIINNGLGPAIVSKFDIYLDGKIHDRDDEHAVNNVFSQLGIDYDDKNSHFMNVANGAVISPNERITLLDIIATVKTQDAYHEIMKAFQRVDLKVKYKCFYGNKFTFHTTK